MTPEKLARKLRLIEALYAGAKTEGERQAAGEARKRILARMAALPSEDPPVEFRFRLDNRWSRDLLAALLRRYGYETYRRRRQRRTTVLARVPRRFVRDTLWPEFREMDLAFRATVAVTAQSFLDDVDERGCTDW